MGLTDPHKTVILDSSVEPLHTLPNTHFILSTTMNTTLSTIVSRNNIMNVLLALCTAIEFVYDCGERFGTWYRNGGNAKIRNAVAMTLAALVWTYETVRLGAQVVRANAPQWLAQANHMRNQLGRAFSYEYTAS